MTKLNILAFAGSLSANSVNKKLIRWSSNQLIDIGYSVDVVELNDYPLEIYNPDISAADFPKNALLLAQLMQDHQVWLISSPEYNYSIPSCLKNVIDYVSRAPENKPNVSLFSNKVAGLLSASPSYMGGIRGLRHLRDILNSLGTVVVPGQANVSNSYSAFNEKGELNDVNSQKAVSGLLAKLVDIAGKLVS